MTPPPPAVQAHNADQRRTHGAVAILPENHPDIPPNSITNGGDPREESRGQTFVAGRLSGEIAEGARGSTHAPDEQEPRGTSNGIETEHSSYAEKLRETGTAGTPW